MAPQVVRQVQLIPVALARIVMTNHATAQLIIVLMMEEPGNGEHPVIQIDAAVGQMVAMLMVQAVK